MIPIPPTAIPENSRAIPDKNRNIHFLSNNEANPKTTQHVIIDAYNNMFYYIILNFLLIF
jgi:hypothetical protein